MAGQTHLTILNLDRPRILRMDLDTLAMLEELMGVKTAKEVLAGLDSFSNIRKAAYCAMLQDAKEHSENLTLDNVGDILRKAEYVDDVIETVVEAVKKCFRHNEEEGAEEVDESTKN